MRDLQGKPQGGQRALVQEVVPKVDAMSLVYVPSSSVNSDKSDKSATALLLFQSTHCHNNLVLCSLAFKPHILLERSRRWWSGKMPRCEFAPQVRSN